MKKTPLYEKHIELNAKLVDFAGYMMPIQYDSITKEHFAVRESAGIFDVSHMGEIIISGKGWFKYCKLHSCICCWRIIYQKS